MHTFVRWAPLPWTPRASTVQFVKKETIIYHSTVLPYSPGHSSGHKLCWIIEWVRQVGGGHTTPYYTSSYPTITHPVSILHHKRPNTTQRQKLLKNPKYFSHAIKKSCFSSTVLEPKGNVVKQNSTIDKIVLLASIWQMPTVRCSRVEEWWYVQ